MIDCKKIKNCANDILRSIKKYKKVKKSDEKILLSMIVKYIDKLIFNYVAMASLLCLKLGIKKIMLKHMLFISKCVDSLCLKSTSKIMRGGAFNTAAFYGIKEDNYKVENEGVDIMNSDLTECIRPALKTTQNGGIKSLNFEKVNYINFPLIKIKTKINEHPSSAIIYNAVNEILVDLFLRKKLPFLRIIKIIMIILKDRNYKKYAIRNPININQIKKIDTWARILTLEKIKNYE